MGYENMTDEQLRREISVYRKKIKSFYDEIRILNKHLEKLEKKE